MRSYKLTLNKVLRYIKVDNMIRDLCLLLFLLIINLSQSKASEIILHFDDVSDDRNIYIFYPIGNFANMFVSTDTLVKKNNFSLKINNEVKIGIVIFLVKNDIGIPLYIEKDEIIDIYISNNPINISFKGLLSEKHETFFEYTRMSYRKSIEELSPCPLTVNRNEYNICLELFFEDLTLNMENKNLCIFSKYHIILDYISKVYDSGDKSDTHIEFVQKLYNDFITTKSYVPRLLLNYSYYWFNSKHNKTSYKHKFQSSDLDHYNFLYNLENKEVLSFMLQVQLASLKQMNYQFINYCGALRETLKYSEGFPQHEFFKGNNDCPDK